MITTSSDFHVILMIFNTRVQGKSARQLLKFHFSSISIIIVHRIVLSELEDIPSSSLWLNAKALVGSFLWYPAHLCTLNSIRAHVCTMHYQQQTQRRSHAFPRAPLPNCMSLSFSSTRLIVEIRSTQSRPCRPIQDEILGQQQIAYPVSKLALKGYKACFRLQKTKSGF